jgi:hypothetical protein
MEGVTQERPTRIEDRPAAQAEIDLLYAANVNEDWEGLADLMAYLRKRRPELLILTGALDNPLEEEERKAFRHASLQVLTAFRGDGNFPDVQLYTESFRHDRSTGILAVSARKILEQIEAGKSAVKERLAKLAGMLESCPCPFYIVPGRFENVDLIRELAPPGLADRYITVRRVVEKGFQILGIGGLPGVSEDCPGLFQDREYIEGSSQANEDVKELLAGVDILVSYAPIKCFTDPGEEKLVREVVSDNLPGKLVLTSQAIDDPDRSFTLTATGPELIRGGSFGRGKPGRSRLFWELSVGKETLLDRSLFELKMRKNFRLL